MPFPTNKPQFWVTPLAVAAAVAVGRELFFDGEPVRPAHAAVAGNSRADRPRTDFGIFGTLPTVPPSTQSTTEPSTRPSAIAAAPPSVDDGIRFTPTTRAYQPAPQHPPEATTQNVDTGLPPHEWQRLTDDWFGLRPKLDDHGIAFAANLALYGGQNFTGGATTAHGGGAYLFNLNVTLDSKKLAGYDGGTFFANFRNEDGLHHSLDGSFGNTSHLYDPARTELSEAYYEQKLADDKLRIRAGKIDANDDFDNASNGGEFLNDFAGHSATILGFPTDPDPAFGAEFFFYPTSHFYAGFGVYDGSLLQGRNTGLLGPATVFHEPSVFLVGEAGASWTAPGSRDGGIGVGVWHHSGDFARYDGGADSGATGPYAVADQTLWRQFPDQDGDTHGIAMFANAGYASSEVSPVNYQAACGVKWTGALAARNDDILGLGVGYLRLSGRPAAGFDERDETTAELYYKMRLTAWFSLEPDLQFVHNPGGTSRQDDALIGTVQALIDF